MVGGSLWFLNPGAGAAVLFQDDFQSDPVNQQITSMSAVASIGYTTIDAVEDTSIHGAGNQVARIADNGTTQYWSLFKTFEESATEGIIRISYKLKIEGTVSFRASLFSKPETTTSYISHLTTYTINPAIGYYGFSNYNGTQYVSTGLKDLEEGVWYEIVQEINIDRNTNAYSITNLSSSDPDASASGVVALRTDQFPVTGFGFYREGSGGVISVDDLKIEAIPEPSTALLLLGAGCLLIKGGKRFRR